MGETKGPDFDISVGQRWVQAKALSRHSPRRIVRFLASGAVVIAAYYAPYYVLTEFLGVWYLASSIIGSIISSITNFLLQKLWAFENKSLANVHWQAFSFALILIAYTLANGGMLYLLVARLHWHYLSAQLLASSILGVVGYFVGDQIFRNDVVG